MRGGRKANYEAGGKLATIDSLNIPPGDISGLRSNFFSLH
jgi:hypothetical protein